MTAAVAVGLMVVGAGDVAASAGKPLILSPSHGERVPAGPVTIGARDRSLRKRFSVQLNGEQIGRHFSRPRHGVRSLEASLTHGLRHGGNSLHVRVGRRSDSTRFQVRRDTHLVGAGADLSMPVGSSVELEGDHDLPGPGDGDDDVAYSWRTVGGPEDTGATRGDLADLDQPEDSDAPQTEFTPSLPGSYSIKLTVTTANGETSSDLTNVEANPTPAVAVDTMAFQVPATSGGVTQSGIQVGDGPCPGSKGCYPSDEHNHWAQLVTLDRKTLLPVDGQLADLANKTYACTGDSVCSGSRQALQSDLARLGPDELVIVANPKPDAGCNPAFVPFGLASSLSRIGVTNAGFADASLGSCSVGSFSAIGVPGTKPGLGDWHAVPEQPGAGRMEGYLVRSNENTYSFEGYDRFSFDTHAEGSDNFSHVMRVGDKTFTESSIGPLDTQGGGFHVLVLDDQTLEGSSHWFPTGNPNGFVLDSQLQAMRQTLHDANADTLHHKLVFIASSGNPSLQYYSANHITAPDDDINRKVAQVVDEVEQLGGTRNAFYKMIDPGLYGSNGYSYTLVSPGNSGPGQGEEAVGTGVSGFQTLSTTRMTGLLARTGPNYGFELQASPRMGNERPGTDPSRASAALSRIALQRPTPWPEHGNAAREAAIAWIGLNSSLKTDDPRGQYWTKAYLQGQFDYNGWDKIAYEIQRLAYPGTPPSDCKPEDTTLKFCPADLEWAKQELAGPTPGVVGGEIAWLEATHKYFDAVATPFADNQLKNWASLKEATHEINKKVDADKDTPVNGTAKAIFDFVRNLATAVPHIGEAIHVVNDLYELAMALSETNEEPTEDTFQSTADKVGIALADRLSSAQQMLVRQLPNVIAADYGKLKTVGGCTALESANCPFNVKDWQYTQDDQGKDAADAIVHGTNVWAYSQLLPAKYTLFKLAPWWRTRVGDNSDFYAYDRGISFDHYVPFRGLPASAEFAKPLYRNAPTYQHTLSNHDGPTEHEWRSTGDTWQIYALGHLEPRGHDFFKMQYPDASVTDRLVKPIDPRNVSDGPLGVDPETFFSRYFTPKPLTEYPIEGEPIMWCRQENRECPFVP